MTVRICGTGACVPAWVMDNHQVAELVDTDDQWIRERTGIERRHIAKEETVVSMAAKAARRALANGGMTPEEVDLIIVSTISSNVILPCAACEVQKEIGAVNAACFDLNAACAGFLMAFNTAQAYLSSGLCRTALIIGSETLSHLTNWEDRGTCILFGDGAGAAVLRGEKGRFYFPVTHSMGEKGRALTCKNRHDGSKLGEQDEAYYMQMDGRAVFQFAVRKVPEVIREALDENQMEPEDIDWFVLHQANKRIVEGISKRLGVPMEKFPMNIQEYGNTSSASIPIMLDEMNRRGCLHEGQKIVLAGFGAGLTWGAAILEWK